MIRHIILALILMGAAQGAGREQSQPSKAGTAPARLRPAGRTAASLFARPFAATSPWNTPIPLNAVFEEVPRLSGIGAGLSAWLIPDRVSIPVFLATPTSARHRLLYHADTWSHLADGTWRTVANTSTSEALILAGSSPRFPYSYHPYVSQSGMSLQLPSGYVPVTNPIDGSAFEFRAPDNIHPTSNPDAHMAVFQPDGTVVETYGTIILSNGTVVAETYQKTSARLAGDGWQNGVAASMIPVYAGLLRQSDLEAGAIKHALKLVVPAELLAPAYTYPALAFDRAALVSEPPYSGTLPMGARLALPHTVNIASLGLETDLGRMIATAAQIYGMLVTDQGGSGVTLITESGLGRRLRWSFSAQNDLDKIVWLLKRAR